MVARVLRIVRVYSQLTTLQAEFLLYLPSFPFMFTMS